MKATTVVEMHRKSTDELVRQIRAAGFSESRAIVNRLGNFYRNPEALRTATAEQLASVAALAVTGATYAILEAFPGLENE